MSEQEEKRARLYEQMESGAATVASQADDDKNRLQAAKQWVNHFDAVLDLIDSLDTVPDNNDDLAKLLVASWKAKAEEKDSKLKARLAKFKA